MNETDKLGTHFVVLDDKRSGWLNGSTNFVSAIVFSCGSKSIEEFEEKLFGETIVLQAFKRNAERINIFD